MSTAISIIVVILFVLFIMITLVRTIRIVPQQTTIIVERLAAPADPGGRLRLIVPFVDRAQASVEARREQVGEAPRGP